VVFGVSLFISVAALCTLLVEVKSVEGGRTRIKAPSGVKISNAARGAVFCAVLLFSPEITKNNALAHHRTKHIKKTSRWPRLLLQQGDGQALPARHVEEHNEQHRLLHVVRGRPDDGGGRLGRRDRLHVGQAGLPLGGVADDGGDAVPAQHVQRPDGARHDRRVVHGLPWLGAQPARDANDQLDVVCRVR
jgi:hypothetical protein